MPTGAPKERGVLSALGLIGVPLGALITAPIVSGFLTVANWRILFVLLGILGLVWVMVWAKVLQITQKIIKGFRRRVGRNPIHGR